MLIMPLDFDRFMVMVNGGRCSYSSCCIHALTIIPPIDIEILRFLQLTAKQVWMTSGWRYWKCCHSKICYVFHWKVPNGTICFHFLWQSILHKQMTIGIHILHAATRMVSYPSVIDCQHITRTTTHFDCHSARNTLHHVHPHSCLMNQSAYCLAS